MPTLFTAEARFDSGKFILANPSGIATSFPYLDGKSITGKVTSGWIEGRTVKVDKDIKFKLVRQQNLPVGEILEPNPVKTSGWPLPIQLLLVAYWYEEDEGGQKQELPLAENLLVRASSYYANFDDEVKRLFREEEAGLILKGTIFHAELRKTALNLKESLVSLEQENFAHSKTACRKALEDIRRVLSSWDSIDGSKSFCEKFAAIANSLYSFASIGGPHEGVATREETDLLVKTTITILLYINTLLKSGRATQKAQKE